MSKLVLFIIGPTGSGKSKLALMLARKLKFEIVSADSMQIYRGMDIGTAKPTEKEQRLVPHHLLDSISSRSECSVYRYRKLALQAIQKIMKKKRIPMIVGGSGFYIKALIDGLGPLPGKHVQLRKKLEQIDLSELYERLKELDPSLAKKIHPNNKKRIVRAIEIMLTLRENNLQLVIPAKAGIQNNGSPIKAFGDDISYQIATPAKKTGGLAMTEYNPILIGLERDRKELYKRIEKRVDQMFAVGWIDEVKHLKRSGFSKTARYAIGYKEISDYLEGKISYDEMTSQIKKRTRHLAKKQLTWFRKDKRIKWYFVSGEKYSSVFNKILAIFKLYMKTSHAS